MNKSLNKDKNKNHTKNATLKKNKSKNKTKKVKTKKVIKNNLSGGDRRRTYKFPRGTALFGYKNRKRNRNLNNSNIFINQLERVQTWHDTLNSYNKSLFNLDDYNLESLGENLEHFDFDYNKLSYERKMDFRVFEDSSSIKSPIRLIDSYFSHNNKDADRLTIESLIETEKMKRAMMMTPYSDTNLSFISDPEYPKYVVAYHGGLIKYNKQKKPEFVGIAEVPLDTTITFMTSIDRYLYESPTHSYNLLNSLTPEVLDNLLTYGSKPDIGEECFKHTIQYLPGDNYPDITLSITDENYTYKGSNPFFVGSAEDKDDCLSKNQILEGIYEFDNDSGFKKLKHILPKQPNGEYYKTGIIGKKKSTLSETIFRMMTKTGMGGHFIINSCRSCKSSMYYDRPELKNMTTAIKSYELFKRLVVTNFDFFINYEGNSPCLVDRSYESKHNHYLGNRDYKHRITNMVDIQRENSQELGVSPDQTTVTLERVDRIKTANKTMTINNNIKKSRISPDEYLPIIKEYVEAIMLDNHDSLDDLFSWESGYKFSKKKKYKSQKNQLTKKDPLQFTRLNQVYIYSLDTYVSQYVDTNRFEYHIVNLLKDLVPNLSNLVFSKFLFDKEGRTEILDTIIEKTPPEDLLSISGVYKSSKVPTIFKLLDYGTNIFFLLIKQENIRLELNRPLRRNLNGYFKNLDILIEKIFDKLTNTSYIAKPRLLQKYFLIQRHYNTVFDLLIAVITNRDIKHDSYLENIINILNRLRKLGSKYILKFHLSKFISANSYFRLKHKITQKIKDKINYDKYILIKPNYYDSNRDIITLSELLKYISEYIYRIFILKIEKNINYEQYINLVVEETDFFYDYFVDGKKDKHGFTEFFYPIDLKLVEGTIRSYHGVNLNINVDNYMEPTLLSVLINTAPEVLYNFEFMSDLLDFVVDTKNKSLISLFYQTHKRRDIKSYLFLLFENLIIEEYKTQKGNKKSQNQFNMIAVIIMELLNIYHTDIAHNGKSKFLEILSEANYSQKLADNMNNKNLLTPLDIILFYYEYSDIKDIKNYSSVLTKIVKKIIRILKVAKLIRVFDGDYTKFYNPDYHSIFQKLIQ